MIVQTLKKPKQRFRHSVFIYFLTRRKFAPKHKRKNTLLTFCFWQSTRFYLSHSINQLSSLRVFANALLSIQRNISWNVKILVNFSFIYNDLCLMTLLCKILIIVNIFILFTVLWRYICLCLFCFLLNLFHKQEAHRFIDGIRIMIYETRVIWLISHHKKKNIFKKTRFHKYIIKTKTKKMFLNSKALLLAFLLLHQIQQHW